MQSIAGTGRALRPVIVVPRLHQLHGPLAGQHRLPLRLDASARPLYDFADPDDRDLAYRIVLAEACSVSDLTDWLDRDALLGLWPHLYLPKNVRAAWERQHSELRLLADPHAPTDTSAATPASDAQLAAP